MPQLIVYVPEIEYLSGGSEALPSGLRRRLARARRVEAGAAAAALDEALDEALGLGALPSAAALSRLALGPIPEPSRDSTWLRFDPIGLVPDLSSVWIERPVRLDFSRAELHALTAELGAMFAARGMAWQPSPGQGFGLLELEAPPAAGFVPLSAVPGRRLDEVLPTGPEARRWRGLINESQMVFHQFRALDRVDQRSLGLWFWGAGSIPPALAAGAASAARLRIGDDSGDARLAGLARWLGVSLTPIDSPAAIEHDETLLLHWPLLGRDPFDALQALEERWLGGARMAVQLVGSRGWWQLAAVDRYAFWRRGPVQGFVEDGK